MLIYQCESEGSLKVAAITFAYKNAEIIHLLKERGQNLSDNCNCTQETLKEVDKRIDSLKEDKFEELAQPASAFVTFQTSFGFNTAMKYMKSTKNFFKRYSPNKNHQIFGVHPIVKKAPEPSNIIWESYSVSQRTARIRSLKTYLFMLFVYALVFFGFWKLYGYPTDFVRCFTVKIDCNEVYQVFTD
jgi:hypothetical protein